MEAPATQKIERRELEVFINFNKIITILAVLVLLAVFGNVQNSFADCTQLVNSYECVAAGGTDTTGVQESASTDNITVIVYDDAVVDTTAVPDSTAIHTGSGEDVQNIRSASTVSGDAQGIDTDGGVDYIQIDGIPMSVLVSATDGYAINAGIGDDWIDIQGNAIVTAGSEVDAAIVAGPGNDFVQIIFWFNQNTDITINGIIDGDGGDGEEGTDDRLGFKSFSCDEISMLEELLAGKNSDNDSVEIYGKTYSFINFESIEIINGSPVPCEESSGPIVIIPTMNQWGLIIATILFGLFAVFKLRTRTEN